MAKKKNKKNINVKQIITSIISIILLLGITYISSDIPNNHENISTIENYNAIVNIPEYSNQIYTQINHNIPYFTQEDYTTEAFEKYSEWDELGRSGVAFANICKEIMPKEGEERGEIGNIKDLSGWVQKRYDNLIKDKYLYNRCHLIGWQLAGENANKKNLITGTRYFNTEGMLPFENKVASYVKENKENVHVLYRVTPIFKGDNLLASGVEMEAYSVEDAGEGVCFNVYVYNVQPGVRIDYKTGESWENLSQTIE